jgi:hypothetical protein
MHVPLRSLLLSLGLASAAGVHADIVISNAFVNFETRAQNSLGFTAGTYTRIGATSVSDRLTGNAIGITGQATTTDATTGALIQLPLNFNPGPVIPNFFSRYLSAGSALSPNFYQPWTLSFDKAQESASTTVQLPSDARPIGFVSSVTLSGTAAAPTFSWTPPARDAVNGYRINIYDRSLMNSDPTKGPLSNGQVMSRDMQTTSYTVNPAHFGVPGYGFAFGTQYAIEIVALQTRDGSTSTNNGNLQAVSRVYADFTPTETGGQQVQLPVIRDDGSFQFNFAVAPSTTYYIDPVVAIGYDYLIGAGNPNFQSVSLPSDIGDGLYDLWLWDGSDWLLIEHDWLGGVTYQFDPLGVDRFRVTGIETGAGLDPGDGTAFVTAVSFTGAGQFTGTQTPITQEVQDVPEPPVVALLLAGLAVMVLRRRHVPAQRALPARLRPAAI